MTLVEPDDYCELYYDNYQVFICMEKNCKRCNKKKECKNICPEVSLILDDLNEHSLKSNYLVKFVDPFILQAKVANYEHDVKISKRVNKLIECIKEYILGLLDTKYKKSIILYNGLFGNNRYTQVEIARRMKVSQNTIKYYLQKFRKEIKGRIII